MTIDITYDVANGPEYMEAALDAICAGAERAVRDGYNIIILSDRAVSAERVPIPSLLATSATHHHLIRKGLRTSVGLVVESGEPREVHQFCTLAGYGAEAINPYLAFETLEEMLAALDEKITPRRSRQALHQGGRQGHPQGHVQDGHLDLSVLLRRADFRRRRPVERIRRRATSPAPRRRSKASASTEIAEEAFRRHADAFGDNPVFKDALDVGGEYAVPPARRGACVDAADRVARCSMRCAATRTTSYRDSRKAGQRAERASAYYPRACSASGRPRRSAASRSPIEDVEPAKDIVKRFATGAMSFGSISREAHTTLAIAMNRIGGKSNTGEGGEEPDRFKPLPNGDSMRSAIKQVASGRFGVTAEYLVNCRHDPDQDGARCEARRRRPIARPQGRRHHRAGALFDAGRRPHLAAAASRHLFDRGSGAAHLRPEERQPAGRDLGQARLRSRRRHGRRRRRQGARRSCHHLGLSKAAPALRP